MESQKRTEVPKKPTKSLRSILTLWFLLFSIVPVAFVTGYSMVQFERAIDEELFKRLRGNAREISVVFSDLENYLLNYGNVHANDPSLVYYMSTFSVPNARRLLQGWMRNYSASKMSLFDREGRMVVALARDASGEPRSQTNLESGDVFLAENFLKQLGDNIQIRFRDISPKSGLELIVYTKILSKKGATVGYLEEIINVDNSYLQGLQKRLNLEIFILDKQARAQVSTSEDILLFPKAFFSDKLGASRAAFFDIVSRGIPYGVKIQPLQDDDPNILLGLAASKRDISNALRGINRALFTIVGVIILLLVIVLLGASNLVLKPLQHLVDAAQKIESGKFGTQIAVESDTEIGLLTESFNKMSLKVAEARAQLETKISELEQANRDLQEAQAQLVHSAKMVSLGQLVAGVAHELNNPIGFIYSNMTHLREYSDKLAKLLIIAEQDPDSLENAKNEMDLDYILEDMPRLIKSCEDGAKRVRDIVLGLRNFSRLDESQVKEVDINESLDNTLTLLSGEIKNRIKVTKNYEKLPLVRCYSSQLNQVFMNILSNAAQAIEGSGEIKIRTSVVNENVRIDIADTGKGMPKGTAEKIFDPFFTTKPVGQGTGLGLSISYGIVQRHGGEILVSSEQGKGTEFSVIIPVAGPLSEKSA